MRALGAQIPGGCVLEMAMHAQLERCADMAERQRRGLSTAPSPPTANGSTHDAHATAGWETAEAEREKTAAMPWAVKEANLVMNKALAAGLLKLAR